jgi:hypothetical protein
MSHDWECTYLSVGHRSVNQSVSGVTTICLMQCDIGVLYRVDLWPEECAKLLDIGVIFNMPSYTVIQSIPNMLNG